MFLNKVVRFCLPLRLEGHQSLRILPALRSLSEPTAPPPTPSSQYGELFGKPSDAGKRQEVFLSGYESIDILKNADENVRKIFDLEFASRREQEKKNMAEMVELYRRQEGDTGSIEVQVATLTLRIKHLTEHLQKHRKDKSCLRGLIQLVQRRRILLLVLKEFDPNMYHKLLTELKLRPPVVTKYQYKTRKGKRSK